MDSPEFKAKNLSDTEYLQVLYRTCLNREGDAGGMAAQQAAEHGYDCFGNPNPQVPYKYPET